MFLVWRIELEAQLREAIGNRVLAELAHLRQDLPPLAPGHGWQSVQSLHELDAFRDLISCVHRVVPGILKSSGSVTTRTKSPPAGRHVYYVRTHAGADTINLHDPRNQNGVIRPPVVELTAGGVYRLVTLVRYQGGVLMIRIFGSHDEYDQIDAEMV
jgi:hypothetical protein